MLLVVTVLGALEWDLINSLVEDLGLYQYPWVACGHWAWREEQLLRLVMNEMVGPVSKK